MGISIRAYARHRGVSDAAVRKAIAAGRITPEADGTIDAERVDREWARNSDAPRSGTATSAASWAAGSAAASPQTPQWRSTVASQRCTVPGRPTSLTSCSRSPESLSSRTAPAHLNDADQLEITRRIEREAGSIYRINGRDARQRDVALLFADAANLPRSTAIGIKL